MNILELAPIVEQMLHDKLDHPSQGSRDPYEVPSSIYGISINEDNEPVVTLLKQGKDVYELLDNDEVVLAKYGYHKIGLLTTGWAAPLGENGEPSGAPSAHPERRRVRLMVVASVDEVASVIRFRDTNETVIDPGSATGTLADALKSFLSR